jgi:hypothetical protein
MHNHTVELQGKCRRLFYAKADMFATLASPDDPPEAVVGDIIGVASGGGAIAELMGDELIIATFNDLTAPERIGCIEEYYSPVPAKRPHRIDMAKVPACCDAVDAHRAAVKAEAEFVFETGIKLFGSEQPTTAALRHILKVQEMHTRDDSGRVSDHDAILQTQTDLEALCKVCDDCCEQLLVTRDDAITFAEPESLSPNG